MGAGGGKWETADVITFARMNQKTLIVQAAEPDVMYAGMLWLDIDDDMLYQRKNANDGWYTIAKEELAHTITGLWTFNRGAAAPFAVDAASTAVTNLDADLVDGQHRTLKINADHTHQSAGAEGGKIDHGLALDGLADDDHTQYLKAAGARNWNIPDPAGDHAAEGITVTATAGEALAFGDVCYFKSDGKFWKADADAEATSKGMLALATAAINAEASGVFLVYGKCRDDTWAWTVAQELYIHTTPGNPTGTRPSGSLDIIRIIGHAYTADVLFFNPDQTYLELA